MKPIPLFTSSLHAHHRQINLKPKKMILGTSRCNVPADDYIVVAGELNGQVGKKTDGNRCHGAKGFETRDEGGERIADFAEILNLILGCNAWFIANAWFI